MKKPISIYPSIKRFRQFYKGIYAVLALCILVTFALTVFHPIFGLLGAMLILILFAHGIMQGLQVNNKITLDYVPDTRPRYGYGSPPHPKLKSLLNQHENHYQSHLDLMSAYVPDWLEFNKPSSDESPTPYINNRWIPALDSLALYYFIAQYKPKLYLEIGSGTSTKFANAAIKKYSPHTKIISIDPHPRSEIDQLADEIIRAKLEDVDLSIFERLDENDIVFYDGSHRSFMNSDVTVYFLDILPNLKSGVISQIHDIFLPNDYLPNWTDRWYNEQYLLACYLLADTHLFQIELPNYYITNNAKLLSQLIDKINNKTLHLQGGSFWLKIR